MIHIDIATVIGKLNKYCRHSLEEAASLCISQQGDEVTVAHVLYKLAQNPYTDLRLILKQAQITHQDFLRHLSDTFVSRADAGGQYPAFSPLLIEAMQEAWLLSSLEGEQTQIRSGSLFLAVLLNAGRYLPLSVLKLLDNINRETLRKNFSQILSESSESSVTQVAESASSEVVSEAETPLDQYAMNFTRAARHGKIDPVLCRDDEIDLMIDILSRRRKNNPIAVGDAGVGKSALIEGLALRIVAGRVPQALQKVEVWGLDIGAMQAGASVKGEFEKRLKAVIDQVKNASPPVILFIDEAHTLIGAGNQAGGSDAANLLKPALARGELRTIAATTWSEYKKYFEKDAALSRRFQLVKLDEPSVEDSIHILRGLRSLYETSHQVYITDEALTAAAALSARYVSGRQLPDKAIDVLDTASARVTMAQDTVPKTLARLDNRQTQIRTELDLLQRERQHGRMVDLERIQGLEDEQQTIQAQKADIQQRWEQQKALVEKIIAARKAIEDPEAQAADDDEQQDLGEWIHELEVLQKDDPLIHLEVDETQIAAVIADWTGIPVNTLTGSSLERLRHLDQYLKSRILGQNRAIDKIHRHLLTAMADLKRQGTPLGAFLLIGPSGVGKTESALQIADYLFGGKQFLTTINMSEYQEKHSLSRLIGSPPGYVGYGEGGVLSEAMRQHPYSVVLLDEVEKAHPDVLNLFYQAFDKGEIADGEGRVIDCKNILFFLTSNLGFDGASAHLSEQDISDEALNQRLRQFLKPALLARMQIVRFDYLDDVSIDAIVDMRLSKLSQQFLDKYKAPLAFDPQVADALRARCTQRENGARMLDASIDGELLPPLSLEVLGHVARGDAVAKARLSYAEHQFSAVVE
jgi:type VI secretion system protein VasG